MKIHDVARHVGVSAMTVSRALNEPTLVSPTTRERVLQAVEELGYIPNGVARSLTQGRTHLIAFVVSDLENPFFTTVSRGVEDVAKRHGYTLLFGNTDEESEKERDYLQALVSRRVDGVLLSTTGGAGYIQLLQARRIPLVLVDRVIPGIDADSVILDAFDGGRLIAAHLLNQGYRDVTFIGGMPGNSTIEARLAGCRQTMRAAGVELSVRPGRLDQASGEQLMAQLCEERVPEAIVAANNMVAVGAVVEMRRRGLRVPEDVGLACFGDIELASLLDPFLTVVQEPAHDLGQQALQLLHDRIRGSDAPAQHRVLPVQLIVRRSTRRPG